MSKPAAKNVGESYSQQPSQPTYRHSDQLPKSVNQSYDVPRVRAEQRTRTTSTSKKSVNYDILEGAILKFEDQLNSCMASHQFAEAEKLKQKIKELRTEVVVHKQKEIDSKNVIEMKKLARGQNEEIQSFTDDWDRRIAVYRQKAQIAEKEMKKKHEEDLRRLEQDLRASLPSFVRTSPKILNLKKMIETLAYQKDFAQADELSLQCLALEEEEMKKSEEQREKKMFFILSQLVTKQKNELAGLRKRISTGYIDLIKLRESENQKFSNKLQTMRKVLETKQHQNTNKFEMLYRNYIPGERLQVRKRGGSVTPSLRNEAPKALNASVIEEPVSLDLYKSSITTRKSSMTPVRKDFSSLDPFMSPVRSNRNQTLAPISPESLNKSNKAGKGM